MSGEHFDLALQDLLDGRLNPDEQARVQAHVDECAECRSVLEDLRRGRAWARDGLPAADVPPDLVDDLRRRLDGATRSRSATWIGRRRFLAIGAGAVAAGLATAVYVRRGHDWPNEAIDAYREFRAGRRPFDAETPDPPALEAFFRTRVPFHTRVFDFGMMNYRLAGGRVDRLGGRAAALYVYAGPDNRHLVCEMFVGTLTELTEPSERREHNGIPFVIYRRGAYTAVFWPETNVLCVVVSDMPAEETIALAFAKAVKT
ncbi:MAG: zf-HC2 domain-containing protein [Acidobacteria bacterium]|nr:zf-HC2 domain-containing protein [Acidobacteriota bacterium]